MNKKSWFVVLFVSIIYFIAFSHRMEVVPFLPELKGFYGVGYAEVGGLVSSFLLGYSLFQIPSGTLADKYPPKRLIFLGTCLMLISSLLFVNTESLHIAFGLRFVMGAASAMLYSPGIKLITCSTPKEKRGLCIGVLQGAAGGAMLLTLTVFPMLSILLPTTYLYVALPVLLLPMLFGIRWLPTNQVEMGLHTKGVQKKETFLSLFRHARVWRLVAIAFFGLFGVYTYIAWMPTYLETVLGYSKQDVGWVMAVMMFSQMIMGPVSGRVSDWIGHRKTLILGTTMLVVSACWFYLLSDWGIYFVSILVGTGISWAQAPMLVLATEMVSVEMVGSVISVTNTIGQIASAASGYVYGKLFDVTGNFQIIWVVCLVFLVIRVLFCLGNLDTKADTVPIQESKPISS